MSGQDESLHQAVMSVLIYRDRVEPGSELAYRAIEEEAARMCVEFDCPHPHVAMESTSGPKEVWWLNTFASEAERLLKLESYASNLPLMTALENIAKRKEGVAGGTDALATYRYDLSNGRKWSLSAARFVVGLITERPGLLDAAVFEMAGGQYVVLTPLRTREEAETIAAQIPTARVFAIRPYWGMAAPEWIAADPEFWKVNPVASAK